MVSRKSGRFRETIYAMDKQKRIMDKQNDTNSSQSVCEKDGRSKKIVDKMVRARRMSINKRVLLIAAGTGNLKKVTRLVQKNVDVDFQDADGDTPLHHAVHSGNVEVVNLLLGKVREICIQNKECKTPLDIARENCNKVIIGEFEKKIIADSNTIVHEYEKAIEKIECDGRVREKSDPVLSEVEKEIISRKACIESCRESLCELKFTGNSDASREDSYEQAYIFICFIEAFALEGSGNTDTKKEMEDYFSLCYSKDDKSRISDVRELLFKSTSRKFSPVHVSKFIREPHSTKSFFNLLKEYLEHVILGLELADMVFAMLKDAVPRASNENEKKDVEEKIRGFMQLIRDEESKNKDNFGILPRKQAIVLDCYDEVYLSKGLNSENIEGMIEAHFSMASAEKDKTKIKDALKDVAELKKYLSEHKSIKLETFLNKLVGKERNFGVEIKDTTSFLREEFQKLTLLSREPDKITHEELFNFIVNFYPVFQKVTNNSRYFKELRHLRNTLVHQFHKYGCMEFRNEISRLRNRIFRFFCAEDIRGVLDLCKTKRDLDSSMLDKNFKKKLESYKKISIRDTMTKHEIPEAEAACHFEYKFWGPVSSQKIDDIEALIHQYLWFEFLLVTEKVEKPDSISQSQKPENLISIVSKTREVKQLHMSDLDRTKMFDDFCNLIKIKKFYYKFYQLKKQEFKEKLIKDYGMQGDNFDATYKLYEKADRDSNLIEKIAKSMKNLKRLKDVHKLSNELIISLYKSFLKQEPIYPRIQHLDQNEREDIYFILANLPQDEKVSTSTSPFVLSMVKFISNMFNTFYNPYNIYWIEFNEKEMFNDEIFLDYLVVSETEEPDVDGLVDNYLTLMLMIDGEKDSDSQVRGQTKKQIITLDCQATRDIYEGFYRLKKLEEFTTPEDPLCDEYYYEKEKQNFMEMLREYHVKIDNFTTCHEICMDNDGQLGHRVVVEKVKTITEKFKHVFANKYSDNIISSLLEIVVETKGEVNSELLKDLLSNEDKQARESVAQNLNNLYRKQKLAEDVIEIKLGGESLEISTKKVVCELLKTFAEKITLKPDNYSVIRKLIGVEYAAPYIVRLITTANSDELIERDDLVKLVEILLLEKGNLYIRHLSDLLSVKSGKLNLYQAVCNKILEHDLDINRVSFIFENPQHVEGIFYVLNREMDSTNAESRDPEKRLEFAKKVLESILQFNAYDRYFSQSTVRSSMVTIFDKLSKKGVIKSDDSIYAEYKYIDTKFMINDKINNFKKKTIQDKAALEATLKEPLVALSEIPHTNLLWYSAALYKKVVLHEMLDQYIEAYTAHAQWYKEIVKFAIGVNDDEATHTQEIYNLVIDSKKYKQLLCTSKYDPISLDIIFVSLMIAENIIRSVITEKLPTQYLNEGIKILKEVTEHYKCQPQNLISTDVASDSSTPKDVFSLSAHGYIINNIDVLPNDDGIWKHVSKVGHIEETRAYYIDTLAKYNRSYRILKDQGVSCSDVRLKHFLHQKFQEYIKLSADKLKILKKP